VRFSCSSVLRSVQRVISTVGALSTEHQPAACASGIVANTPVRDRPVAHPRDGSGPRRGRPTHASPRVLAASSGSDGSSCCRTRRSRIRASAPLREPARSRRRMLIVGG
jgi:hypothetical protein